MNEAIKDIKNKTVPTLKRHGVTKAAVFGSFARGDYKKKSDIDMLIKFKQTKRIGLFEFVGIKHKLEEKLGRKVDLLTYDGLHPLLKDRILNEQKKIYEKRSSPTQKTDSRNFRMTGVIFCKIG